MKRIKQPQKLISYFMAEYVTVIFIVIFGILFDVGAVFGPVMQGKLLDAIVLRQSIKNTLIWGGIYVGTILLIQTMRFFKRYFVRLFANRTGKTMRLMMYNSIINLPLMQAEKESYGDLMTKCIGDVDITVEGMRKFITEVFDTGILMCSYLAYLLIYDTKITLISCAFIPVAMIFAELLKKTIYKSNADFRNKSSEVAELTYQLVDNTILFRNYGVLNKKNGQYENELETLKHSAIKASMFENSMPPIYKVIASLGIICVIYSGGQKVLSGAWSIGTFSAYLTIFTAFTVKASKAGKLFNSVHKAKISWLRIKDYLQPMKYKDEIDNTTDEGILEVNNLSFGFESDKNLFENISFIAHKGQIIGVTGPIACGKSAFGACMSGLYSYQGSIKLNGIELKDYTEYQRSKLISYQSHNPYLLSDTIKSNVALGNDGDISKVLSDICFDKDLQEMPDGINTVIGSSGIRLSGGQQSRLAMARALYNKNQLIILDDPFSAVDMQTEEQIIVNLRKNYSNSIIILISHRLSIFDKVDQVIMFDKNVICGTNNEVRQKSPLYRKIYDMQKEYSI